MRQVAGTAGRLGAAALLAACVAACAAVPQQGEVSRSTTPPAAEPMAGIDLPAVVEMLAEHTFACSDPVPDPVVALVTYSCTTVTEDLDTTGTAIVIIEASPDGQRVFQLEGRLAIRTGPPDDDLAVGLCGSVLGALPFAEPAPPDFARWVASNLEAGADRRFGSLQVDLYGPPADRRCRFSAA